MCKRAHSLSKHSLSLQPGPESRKLANSAADPVHHNNTPYNRLGRKSQVNSGFCICDTCPYFTTYFDYNVKCQSFAAAGSPWLFR